MSVLELIPQAHAAGFDPAVLGKVMEPIFTNIITPIILFVFGLAVFFFAYGVIEMIIKGEDPAARKTGQFHMLAAVFGMFLMLSAWGIIRLVSNTLKALGQ